VCAGDAILALASEERGGRYDPFALATRAESTGEGFRISGEKVQVIDGAAARAIVVVARTAGGERERDGISLFLVPADASGVEVERQRRVDSRGAAIVRLRGVQVGRDALVGPEGGGAALLEEVVDVATAGLCAEMLGSSAEAFDRTLGYLKDRMQFGVPIGSFQALKHRAANLFIELELVRSAVMAAARALDEGSPDARALVSLAKARASETAVLVANEAVQMHGGIGMTDEHDIGFYFKRARVAECSFGDAAYHRDRWARLLGY
jgi:alkylation response protein AidB-like acyl-CoA dehydrogenase